MFDGSNVNLLVAFFAGIISFLAPCLLALVPVWAVSIGFNANRKVVVINSLFFIFGFLLIFIILGIGAGSLGSFLVYREFVGKVAGALLVFLGLWGLGVLRPLFFHKSFKFDSLKIVQIGKLSAFFLGIAFGFSWSPCIGPVLAVILLLATTEVTVLSGVLLLFAYGMGMAIPFLLLNLFFPGILERLAKWRSIGGILNVFLNLIVIFVGIILLFDQIAPLINLTIKMYGLF